MFLTVNSAAHPCRITVTYTYTAKPRPTGQHNGGDANKRMAAVTKMIDGNTQNGRLI